MLLLFAALVPGSAPNAAAATKAAVKGAARTDGPFWAGHPDTTAFQKMENQRLERAKVLIDKMVAVKGKRTIENTLRPYDDALIELEAVASQSSLVENVHPDAALRSAAEALSQKAEAFSTALTLNHQVYEALAGVDLAGADRETKYYVEKTLREFRLRRRRQGRRDAREGDEAARRAGRDRTGVLAQHPRGRAHASRSKDARELDGLPAGLHRAPQARCERRRSS